MRETETTNPNLIRNILFGLNMKLPVLFEVRENLDQQIRAIQAEINAWSARLNGRNGDTLTVRGRRGRPPRALIKAAAEPGENSTPTVKLAPTKKPVSRGWGDLTAAERSVEMKRRMAVAKEKKTARETEEARRHKSEVLSATRKRLWEAMTPAEQKAHLAKMVAGRKAHGNYGRGRKTALQHVKEKTA